MREAVGSALVEAGAVVVWEDIAGSSRGMRWKVRGIIGLQAQV